MTIIKTTNSNRVFRRIHDGFIFGREIVLGIDYSTGDEREDLPEYYEEVLHPDAPLPPQMFPFVCEIIPDLQLPFRNGVFRISGFEVPLETINAKKVVNVAYLYWKEFRAELDRKYPDGSFVHQAIKDNLMDLWDFVELHAKTIEPWMADPVNNQLSEFIIYTP
jgi:hypothetical protein